MLSSVISQEVGHEFHGFLFSEYRYKRKKFGLRSLVGNGYFSLNVTQQNLLVMLIGETSLSILMKVCRVCLKKYLKNLVNFTILYCIL